MHAADVVRLRSTVRVLADNDTMESMKTLALTLGDDKEDENADGTLTMDALVLMYAAAVHASWFDWAKSSVLGRMNGPFPLSYAGLEGEAAAYKTFQSSVGVLVLKQME